MENINTSDAITALTEIANRREKYIKRLANEWAEHKRIIIGLDFDDTISPWKMATIEECNRVIEIVRIAQETGAFLTIHTACAPERYDYIKKYCLERGLKVDSINQNPIPLPYGNVTKPYANIFIDDRAGLEEALIILSSAMYKIRAMQHGERLDYPGSLG